MILKRLENEGNNKKQDKTTAFAIDREQSWLGRVKTETNQKTTIFLPFYKIKFDIVGHLSCRIAAIGTPFISFELTLWLRFNTRREIDVPKT